MAQALRHGDAEATRAQDRYDELRRILEERQQTLRREVSGGLRGVRAEHEARPLGSQDAGEVADADIQDEIQFALLEMKAETLRKVDDALARLEAGRYGLCHACGTEIAEARLRALPFAVRCQPCEASRESEFLSAQAQSRRVAPLFEVLG